MKLDDIAGLRRFYQNVKNEATKEVIRLKAEVQESEQEIHKMDLAAREAAKVADNEAYKNARLSADMHRERIEMDQVKIIDLECKHLIDDSEYDRVNKELKALQNRLTNTAAAELMEMIENMRNVAARYEDEMGTLNRFGSFLQHDIYRDDSYRPIFKLPGISSIVRLIDSPNMPWSTDMFYVKQAAGHYVKGEALRKSAGKNEKLLQKAEREAQAGELPEIASEIETAAGE